MSIDTFTHVCIWWSVVAIFTFILLQFITAPYGRHFKHGWGIEVSNQLGWILMEAPSFFIMLYFFISEPVSNYAMVLFMAWLIHYFNRTFIFPFRLHTKGKKMPLAILGSAIGFNTINAGLNGFFLVYLSDYADTNFQDWNFAIGSFLLVTGFIINQFSDSILINLRSPEEKGYKIPHGFLFKYISCPNHLGEIIEWLGFALVAWNCSALTFFIWTLANLIPRAMKHHKWYQSQFDDYPKERKALIPKII